MKRFGTIDTFVETSPSSLKIGRLVANFEFLRALLSYGTFDEYRLFCPSTESRQMLEDALTPELKTRVRLSQHVELLDALREEDFSAFHLGDWHHYLPKLARLRSRNATRPFPLTGPIHSLDGEATFDHVADLLRSPVEAWDAVVCTSSEGSRVFRNMMDAVCELEDVPPGPEPRLAHIPLGVPVSMFAVQACAQAHVQARADLGLPEDAVCFLYLGRVSIVTKGDLGPLLYAFRVLVEHQREDRPVRLIIAGSGGQADWVNLLVQIRDLGLEENVELRGSVEDADKARLLAACDVFVSPVDSLQETFGISVVEAMAAGLPVIASDFDGYRDLVDHGITGFRIPTWWTAPPEPLQEMAALLEYRMTSLHFAQSLAVDVEALLEAMVRLAGDPALRARMGDAARLRAREHFAWDRVIPRYEALWAELKAQAVFTRERAKAFPASRAFECFRRYPTRVLQATDHLEPSLLAPAILEGALPMPPRYEELSDMMPFALLQPVFGAIALEAGTRPWGDLRPALSHAHGIAEDRLDHLVLWMLKRGLLRFRTAD